jgi:hypothetical protein
MLSVEDLLAGSKLTFEIEIPADVLTPAANGSGDKRAGSRQAVRLRPLTLQDLQIISRAARESDSLLATLMVHRSLVEPAVSVAEVVAMHVGLIQFLVEKVKEISGISTNAADLVSAVDAPLARAAFILASEYGWTPQDVNDLTLGQVLLHLKMLQERQV